MTDFKLTLFLYMVAKTMDIPRINSPHLEGLGIPLVFHMTLRIF